MWMHTGFSPHTNKTDRHYDIEWKTKHTTPTVPKYNRKIAETDEIDTQKEWKNELLTLPGHLISPQLIVGFLLLNLLFSIECFVDHVSPFVFAFLLAIVLSILLWVFASDYIFGIIIFWLSKCALRMMCVIPKSNIKIRYVSTFLNQQKYLLEIM
jgi:hypothetical protein